MIFIDVHSAKLGTFARNTWANKLAHAIVLCNGKIIAVKLVHLISHSFGKQLASNKSCFELQVSFGVKTHLSSHLADTESIGRCCNQQSCTVILHVHYLLFGVACGRGDNAGTYSFKAVM